LKLIVREILRRSGSSRINRDGFTTLRWAWLKKVYSWTFNSETAQERPDRDSLMRSGACLQGGLTAGCRSKEPIYWICSPCKNNRHDLCLKGSPSCTGTNVKGQCWCSLQRIHELRCTKAHDPKATVTKPQLSLGISDGKRNG
jgi:hypothetical protein